MIYHCKIYQLTAWLSQIVTWCGSTEFTVEMGQISTHTVLEILRKLTGKHQSTINKLTNCILWCLCRLVCFHIFILTADERPAVLPKYYHHTSHQNPILEAKITQETVVPREYFSCEGHWKSGDNLTSSSSLSLPCLKGVCLCLWASLHSQVWATHTCNIVVTSSSVCLSLAAGLPWSLAYSSQDLFPPCCSLQIWTSNSPKQGTTYILYMWDLENKPSNA